MAGYYYIVYVTSFSVFNTEETVSLLSKINVTKYILLFLKSIGNIGRSLMLLKKPWFGVWIDRGKYQHECVDNYEHLKLTKAEINLFYLGLRGRARLRRGRGKKRIRLIQGLHWQTQGTNRHKSQGPEKVKTMTSFLNFCIRPNLHWNKSLKRMAILPLWIKHCN